MSGPASRQEIIDALVDCGQLDLSRRAHYLTPQGVADIFRRLEAQPCSRFDSFALAFVSVEHMLGQREALRRRTQMLSVYAERGPAGVLRQARRRRKRMQLITLSLLLALTSGAFLFLFGAYGTAARTYPLGDIRGSLHIVATVPVAVDTQCDISITMTPSQDWDCRTAFQWRDGQDYQKGLNKKKNPSILPGDIIIYGTDDAARFSLKPDGWDGYSATRTVDDVLDGHAFRAIFLHYDNVLSCNGVVIMGWAESQTPGIPVPNRCMAAFDVRLPKTSVGVDGSRVAARGIELFREDSLDSTAYDRVMEEAEKTVQNPDSTLGYPLWGGSGEFRLLVVSLPQGWLTQSAQPTPSSGSESPDRPEWSIHPYRGHRPLLFTLQGIVTSVPDVSQQVYWLAFSMGVTASLAASVCVRLLEALSD